MSEIKKLDKWKSKYELMKELMISGEQYINTDWAIKNILNISREDFRKDKIKNIFNG